LTTVNMLEAKTKLSKLVEAVETGAEQEIVLARNGRPVARIVPLEKPAVDVSKRLGIAEGQLGDLSLAAMSEWKRETRDMWKAWLKKPPSPKMPKSTTPRRRNQA
jgi:prevent-host-death family protein